MAGSTTTSRFTQPVLVGGVVAGALSALPLISAGNLCCCLWLITGGVVAAYVFQQNQTMPMTPGDGALVGVLAGVTGAFVYLVLTIPITILLSPLEQAVMDRLSEMTGNVPPEFRGYVARSIGNGVRIVVGFMMMLFLGSFFSTLGGLLGAAIFRKSQPPFPQQQPIDIPPTS